MSKPYLKQCLKDLDRELGRVSKKARVEALSAYEIGLRFSFSEGYPDKFSFDREDLAKVEKIFRGFYDSGEYVGKQFGPLEVESAREYLLAEIEKRKTKFSKPSRLEEFYGLFGKINKGFR